MLTTQVGTLNGCNLINDQFNTLWIPGEQEDLSSLTLKKPVTVEYVAANQIKIVGLDWSDRIQKGTRFRFKQGGDFKYFECTAVSVNADTLVTVDGHGTYTVENATITDFWFCNNVNPFGWPEAWGVETRLEAIEKTDIGGWTSGLTAVYVSATSIKIEGLDVTDRMQKGTRFRYKQGAGWKFGFCSGTITFSTDSTIPISGGSDFTVANAPITDFAYSNIINPIGWPEQFNWAVNPTGFSGTPTATGKFSIEGGKCNYYVDITGTSNSVDFGFDLPLDIATPVNAPARIRDNGAAGVGVVAIASGKTVTVFKDATALQPFTASGLKALDKHHGSYFF